MKSKECLTWTHSEKKGASAVECLTWTHSEKKGASGVSHLNTLWKEGR